MPQKGVCTSPTLLSGKGHGPKACAYASSTSGTWANCTRALASSSASTYQLIVTGRSSPASCSGSSITT